MGVFSDTQLRVQGPREKRLFGFVIEYWDDRIICYSYYTCFIDSVHLILLV